MTFITKIRMHASEDRLEKLIEERTKASEEKKKEIDQRIWDLFGEDWSILFTDLSGFSRKVAEFGIIHFLQVIHESKKLLVPLIDHFDGILLKVEGDSMMVIFRNPKKAVECAVTMNQRLKEYNKSRSEVEQILLCTGIGHGRVIRIGDDDVFGSEVNAASKLGEDSAKAWDILVTDSIEKLLKKEFTFEKLEDIPPGAKGAFRLKY
ncbi:MAG: adenylate cyclase [Candidatus Yonathbacteria bacterium RIFCSPLOWO2_01_FULL_43_20]|nr:MAG: adenylate cyclase [Candidatus Yonathbacteria bacterium RIFCSPLOWO2_01_FULL_43_20]